jgi:hypothetical protein
VVLDAKLLEAASVVVEADVDCLVTCCGPNWSAETLTTAWILRLIYVNIPINAAPTISRINAYSAKLCDFLLQNALIFATKYHPMLN